MYIIPILFFGAIGFLIDGFSGAAVGLILGMVISGLFFD